MLNYEHETKTVESPLLKQYVFNDYFHDAIIQEIKTDCLGRRVSIRLSCEREWPEHDVGKYENDAMYIYELCFHECVYSELVIPDKFENDWCRQEYLNGRFKRSAQLIELERALGKTLYHLRIQLSNGYYDIIFKEFTLSKKLGTVEIDEAPKTLQWHFDWITEKFADAKLTELEQMVSQKDGFLRELALEMLWLKKAPNCYSLAEKAMDDDSAWIAAVYILGESREKQYLDLLTNMMKIRTDCMERRHIRDAIEKIIDTI